MSEEEKREEVICEQLKERALPEHIIDLITEMASHGHFLIAHFVKI